MKISIVLFKRGKYLLILTNHPIESAQFAKEQRQTRHENNLSILSG